MKILGIESSCDETAAAVVEDGKTILSNVVYSQVEIHKKFDGVVPEVASRNHLVKILDVIESALGSLTMKDIDAVAVTNGPGLLGALLVGVATAKSIAYTHALPLVPVNHIYAHMYAPHLQNDIAFPYIGLAASGGHTILYDVKSFGEMEALGSTIDDAVGEAFDKVAKMLGLPYPGGPFIEKAAEGGDSDYMKLPHPMESKKSDRLLFSYSGLKTAVAFRLRGVEMTPKVVSDTAASFQKAAVEMLVRKSKYALEMTGYRRLVVSGGVSANTYLRQQFEAMKKQGFEIYTAPLALCGDNAAMVAGRAFCDLQAGRTGDLRMQTYSRLPRGKRTV